MTAAPDTAGVVLILVPKSWSSDMADAAWTFAKDMTEDREKQAYIVGVLHMSWPALLNAALPPAVRERNA